MERIQQLNNENIILVTNNVKLTSEVVAENRNQVRELLKEIEGPVVIIVDFREVKSEFKDIIDIMRGNQAGKRKDLNQRTFTIFVGTDRLIDMLRNSMRLPQFGEVTVPYFDDLDSALEAARIFLSQHQKNHTSKSPQ